jgi:pSer/pThr/pTyr-binding forkhead associated (FHA) protein
VSRRHAQLTHRDGKWVIQDLASTNGTLVNGERVGRAALRAGDLVTLGELTILLD